MIVTNTSNNLGFFPIFSTNAFDQTKNKHLKKDYNFVHMSENLNTLLAMFEYKNLPKSLPQKFLERMLLENGTVGIVKNKNGDLISIVGGFSDNVNDYGLGTHYTGSSALESFDLPVYQMSDTVDNMIVVGWNNSLGQSEIYQLQRFSDFFSEIDISYKKAIMHTRYYPIPVANDRKEKESFIETLKKLNNGEPDAFLSENLLKKMIDGGESIFPVVNISDFSKVEKIQYLCRLYDDFRKNFYNRYGHSLQSTNKLAQTNLDEIHGEDSVSFIYPLDMLKNRKEMVKNINTFFGTDIKISFSEAWEIEYRKFKNSLEEKENNIAENINNDMTENTDTENIEESEGNENE